MPALPSNLRRKITARLKRGVPPATIARALGVSDTTVRRMRDQADDCPGRRGRSGLVWSNDRFSWITVETVAFAARAERRRSAPGCDGSREDTKPNLNADDAAGEKQEREIVYGSREKDPPAPGALLVRALRLASAVYVEPTSGTSNFLERKSERARDLWKQSLLTEAETAGGMRAAIPVQGPAPAALGFCLTK